MRGQSLFAFTCGFMSVAMAMWMADARAQSAAAHACVAADGTLSIAAPTGCPAGRKAMAFALDVGPQTAQGPAIDKASQVRIVALQRRVAELEDAASRGELGSKVVEPFTVLNSGERPIFEVLKTAQAEPLVLVRVSNNKGQTLVAMEAGAHKARFGMLSPTKQLEMRVGVEKTFTGLIATEKGHERINFGRTPEVSDRYVLHVNQEDGKVAASIGEGKDGGGVAVGDRDGAKVVMIADNAAGPRVVIQRPGSMLGVLERSESGGGVFRIFNAAGDQMVEAIAGKDGYGVVAAGPNQFKPGTGFLGLPASYIAGKPKQ